jgi:hypothetical protein
MSNKTYLFILLLSLVIIRIEAKSSDAYHYMDEIALKAGTDKSSDFHDYTNVYSRYFNAIRDQKLTFLEIGVYKGDSVKLWERYFPNAKLHFIDITPALIHYYSPRAQYHFFDQTDVKALHALAGEVGGNFDIIIDDGGHRMDQQIISFETLFPYVKSGGFYVIEDLHTSYWMEYGGHGTIGNPIAGPGTCVEFLKGLIDDMNKPAGITQCADLSKVSEDLYNKLKPYQKYIDSIHFHQSVCIIIKR